MSRLRRYLPPLLLLSPLIFICGKLLLTSVAASVFVAVPSSFRGKYIDVPERGWPWLYQQVNGTDWKFHVWPLLADIAALLTVLGFAAVLLAIHHRRRGAWFRFSLCEFLALTAVLAAALGWWMSQYHAYGREQAMIRYLEFRDKEAIADGHWQNSIAQYDEDHSPHWTRRIWLGEPIWFFKRVDFIHFGSLSREKQSTFAQEIPRRLETAIKALP